MTANCFMENYLHHLPISDVNMEQKTDNNDDVRIYGKAEFTGVTSIFKSQLLYHLVDSVSLPQIYFIQCLYFLCPFLLWGQFPRLLGKSKVVHFSRMSKPSQSHLFNCFNCCTFCIANILYFLICS